MAGMARTFCFMAIRYLIWAGLMGVVVADPATISLGDLNGYAATVASTPSMTGLMISCTPAGNAPDDGINVFLSAELHDKVKQTLDTKCKALGQDCFQSVTQAIASSQPELETRDVKDVVVNTNMLGSLLGVFFPLFYKDKPYEPKPVHLRRPQLSQASAAATASVVVVHADTGAMPVVTINTPPMATMAPRPDIEGMTKVSDNGTVRVRLPKDLAGRIFEILKRTDTSKCPDAAQLFPGVSKRVPEAQTVEELRRVLCNAERIVLNTGTDAALQQLQLVPRDRPGAITFTDATRQAALLIVRRYATDRRHSFRGLRLEQVQRLAGLAFAIALRYVLEPAAAIVDATAEDLTNLLLMEFYISDVLYTDHVLENADAVPVVSDCATVSGKQCTANCQYIGMLQECDTSCTTTSAATVCEGDEGPRGTVGVTTAAIKAWDPANFLGATFGLDDAGACALVPVTTTIIPPRYSTTIVACTCGCADAPDAGTPLYWGSDKAGKTTTSWCMSGTWAPPGYTHFTQGCSPTPTPTSTQTPRPTERLPVKCDPDRIPKYDIAADKQAQHAPTACQQWAASQGWHIRGGYKRLVSLQPHWCGYEVVWLHDTPGCGEDHTAQPLLGTDECAKVLIDAYRQCNNHGVGGAIQIGCLAYGFQALEGATFGNIGLRIGLGFSDQQEEEFVKSSLFFKPGSPS